MIKFDLSEIYNLENISNLQLELLESKKSILEELKYSDQTLSARIFKEMVENICGIFDDIFIPLNIRKKLLLKQIIYAEKAAADKKKFGDDFTVGMFHKYKIPDRFEIKKLKYRNKLLYDKATAEWLKIKKELGKPEKDIKTVKKPGQPP
jgi:hypothetical protein